MPIETILPDATTTANPAWSGTIHTALATDDTTSTQCSTVGESFVVSFGNLTASNIDSINSITFSVIGNVGGIRGVTAVCTFILLDSSDSSYNLNEDKSFTDATHSTTQAGTTRTTSDGSTAWTESDVNGLRMGVKYSSITNPGANINLDFLKIDVDYNETAVVIPTYDNTLNNITMNLGTTVISGGTIVLD